MQLEAESAQGPGGPTILPVQGQEPPSLACTGKQLVYDGARMPCMLQHTVWRLCSMTTNHLVTHQIQAQSEECLHRQNSSWSWKDLLHTLAHLHAFALAFAPAFVMASPAS